jgi:hypothetical protein
MKREHIYKLVLFLLIIVLVDQFVGRFIAHYALKYKHDKRIGLLVDNKLDQDIIVLGSSRALNGIDPNTIQKETNQTCFNLALSGSNIEFHETILELILHSKNHPKTIIYNIDDPGTLDNLENEVIYRTEELYPYVYNDFINQTVADRLDKTYWVTKLSPTYHNNVNFMTTVKYFVRGSEKISFEINNIDKYGANLMEGHQKGKENISYQKSLYKYENEVPSYVSSFLSIISKCKNNNIQLIMVLPPTFYAPTLKFKKRILELINDQCIVLDYSEKFMDNRLFYNHGHLNKQGAQKFSKLIANQITKENK